MLDYLQATAGNRAVRDLLNAGARSGESNRREGAVPEASSAGPATVQREGGLGGLLAGAAKSAEAKKPNEAVASLYRASVYRNIRDAVDHLNSEPKPSKSELIKAQKMVEEAIHNLGALALGYEKSDPALAQRLQGAYHRLWRFQQDIRTYRGEVPFTLHGLRGEGKDLVQTIGSFASQLT